MLDDRRFVEVKRLGHVCGEGCLWHGEVPQAVGCSEYLLLAPGGVSSRPARVA